MKQHRHSIQHFISMRTHSGVFMLLLLAIPAGCSVNNYTREQPAAAQVTPHHQIIAFIDGNPITHDQIQESLSERAGRQAIADLILDYQLEKKVTELSIRITRSDLDREEQQFLDLIQVEDDPNANLEYMKEVRRNRGLGPTRYNDLLRRNAILRKLINAKKPSEAELLQALQVNLGQQFQIRLFVNSDRSLTNTSYQRVLDAQPESTRWIFAQESFDHSSHPSADRGGFIQRFSTLDSNYPSVLRSSVQATDIGTMSNILATDSGYAFVLVESITPEVAISNEQRELMEEQLIIRNQRIAMEQLASDLIRQSEIIILDKALSWSWKNAP